MVTKDAQCRDAVPVFDGFTGFNGLDGFEKSSVMKYGENTSLMLMGD